MPALPDSPVVVITGASAGVGRATTRAFARRGARLGLVARDRDRLERTRREVERLGGQAEIFATDVTDAEGLERVADAVEERFGPIDIWINNAMTSVFGELAVLGPEEFRRVTDVVYHGTVYGTMTALRRMLPRDHGTIVLVGSALAYRGIPLQSAYCGAKHAIHGMFESLRAELRHRHSRVHVTMVQLPAMNTPQFRWVRNKTDQRVQPVPPIYQPEIGADAVVHAATHSRREVYVGGSSIFAIIGNKIAPAVAERYLGAKGYASQHTPETDPPREDNLWEPVPGPFAAHGPFDARAHRRSPAWWASKHRVAVGLAVGALALGAIWAARR